MTTTSPSPSSGMVFEPPELLINEATLSGQLALEINVDNFSKLLTANFLLTLDARDRKLTRQSFEEVLVLTFNFQNRLVRIAQLSLMLEALEKGKDGIEELKRETGKQLEQAKDHQHNLLQVLRLFTEMRTSEDPVS